MRITSITFERTVQVKQYEPAHWSATVELAEGDDPAAALEEAKRVVNDDVRVLQRRLAEIEEAERQRRKEADRKWQEELAAQRAAKAVHSINECITAVETARRGAA